MDKLKDPAMILSIANSSAIIGITAYFYQQQIMTNNNLKELSGRIAVAIKELDNVKNMSTQTLVLGNNIDVVNKSLHQIKKRCDDFATQDDFTGVTDNIEKILQALKDQGLDVKIKKNSGLPKRKKNNKKKPIRKQEELEISESSSEEDSDGNESDDDSEILNSVRRKRNSTKHHK